MINRFNLDIYCPGLIFAIFAVTQKYHVRIAILYYLRFPVVCNPDNRKSGINLSPYCANRKGDFIVSTQSSIGIPFAIIVHMIFDVMIKRILSFTPLPMPSASTTPFC